MSFSAKEMILQRKSVRTFDGKTLSEEDRKNLEGYIQSPANPFGVPVGFRLLDAKEHQLSSPVIVGEHTYLAAKVKKVRNYELAFGYKSMPVRPLARNRDGHSCSVIEPRRL